mgnify:CR=1 FL=1
MIFLWTGSVDYKEMLTQMKIEHQEASVEVQRLMHAELQLQVLLAEQSSIDITCLFSLTKSDAPLVVVEQKENPTLQFQTKKDTVTGQETEVLYAGQSLGLLSYLYAKWVS